MPKNQKTKKKKPRAAAAAAAAAGTILETIVEGIAVADSQNKLIQANEALAKLLGYNSVKEMLGMDTADLVPKRETPRIMEAGKECIKKGTLKNFETVALRKDGREVPVQLNGTVLKDPNGKFVGNISVIRDITERKKAERKIRNLNQVFEGFLSSVPVIVTRIDENGIYTHSRGSGLKKWGLKENQLVGTNIFEAYPQIKDKVKKALKGEEVQFIYEGAYEGKNLYFQNYFFPDNITGKGMIAIAIDITERKRAEETIEQLKELDELKDNFLNITAHGFKTPLTSIVGLSEVLKEQKSSLDSEQQKHIDIIHEESLKLSHIVKQILTVTRFESGREIVHVERFNLVTLISSFLPSLNILAREKKSKVITNIEKKNIVIRSDKEKISQVIYNLVDNALKYEPEGQTIIISITKPKKNWVKIGVKDQGPGIPLSLQKKLFTKFGQLEPSLSRAAGGVGLGLYICKLITDMLGGKIGVKSVSRKGSTFYFMLPVKKER